MKATGQLLELDQIEGCTAYIKIIGTRAEEKTYKRLLMTLTSAHRVLHNRMHLKRHFQTNFLCYNFIIIHKFLIDEISKGYIKEAGTDEWYPFPRYKMVCNAEGHDHLPGDTSYGYFYERRKFFNKLNEKFGDSLILNRERPHQDSGVWDALYLDSLY